MLVPSSPGSFRSGRGGGTPSRAPWRSRFCASTRRYGSSRRALEVCEIFVENLHETNRFPRWSRIRSCRARTSSRCSARGPRTPHRIPPNCSTRWSCGSSCSSSSPRCVPLRFRTEIFIGFFPKKISSSLTSSPLTRNERWNSSMLSVSSSLAMRNSFSI